MRNLILVNPADDEYTAESTRTLSDAGSKSSETQQSGWRRFFHSNSKADSTATTFGKWTVSPGPNTEKKQYPKTYDVFTEAEPRIYGGLM